MHRDSRAAVLICAVLASSPAFAANPNGIPFSAAAGNQTTPVAVSDGAGGVIVAGEGARGSPGEAPAPPALAERRQAVPPSRHSALGIAGHAGPADFGSHLIN